MATWEDGPEYAPHERPQYFADAPVPPLDQAPPVEPLAGGPSTARPHFDQPSAPVAPLATLVPAPPDERDPHRPFDTVTSTMTSVGWGADAPFEATAPFSPSAAAQTATPAAGAPWPVLEQPSRGADRAAQAAPPVPGSFPPVGGPPAGGPSVAGPSGGPVPQPGSQPGPQPDPYAYPTPGTPGWFAPPPAAYGDQQRPGRVDARQVVEAATPGLCICLALGGLIYVLAPILLVVAVFLSTRVKVAQRALRTAFRIAAGAVALFAVVGLFRSVFEGDPWWRFVAGWSAGICWVMLGILLLVVWQSLVRPTPPAPPAPPTSNPWG
ncbi:hypothetical protein GCM10022197_31870 [Microlunatus spumicola]|uniref:DUF4190 domain-containing protein n=1 Tax=Microlunatus spumicola TaxID=81499 RepID=A0ABP6XUL0_9ACTN